MSKFKYHADATHPHNDEIFVFGSNLSGWHGAGAAKAARDHYGALVGVGVGFTGRSYAIPTKNYLVETMRLDQIAPFIQQFVHVTNSQQQLDFFITRVGCGLAGYKDDQIAPLFANCNPENCSMPEPWRVYLEN
jgi:hypothetical protein